MSVEGNIERVPSLFKEVKITNSLKLKEGAAMPSPSGSTISGREYVTVEFYVTLSYPRAEENKGGAVLPTT
jgi:hypothetical protein